MAWRDPQTGQFSHNSLRGDRLVAPLLGGAAVAGLGLVQRGFNSIFNDPSRHAPQRATREEAEEAKAHATDDTVEILGNYLRIRDRNIEEGKLVAKKFFKERRKKVSFNILPKMPRFTRKRKRRTRGRRSSLAKRRRRLSRKYRKRRKSSVRKRRRSVRSRSTVYASGFPRTKYLKLRFLKQCQMTSVAGNWVAFNFTTNDPANPLRADLDSAGTRDGVYELGPADPGDLTHYHSDQLLGEFSLKTAADYTNTIQPQGWDEVFEMGYDRCNVEKSTTTIHFVDSGDNATAVNQRLIAGWAKGTYHTSTVMDADDFRDNHANLVSEDISRLLTSKLLAKGSSYIAQSAAGAGLDTVQSFTKSWTHKGSLMKWKKNADPIDHGDELKNWELSSTSDQATFKPYQTFIIADVGKASGAAVTFNVFVERIYYLKVYFNVPNKTVGQSVV